MSLWRRFLRWRKPPPVTIAFDAAGFTFGDDRDEARVAWDAVMAVSAFKRDLYTVDLLCIAIGTEDMAVELNEAMPGFAPFLEAMEARLGFPAGWQLDVLFPAFETKLKTLYQRQPGWGGPAQ